MVILQRWPDFMAGRMVVTVVTLMDGEWSCYRGGH